MVRRYEPAHPILRQLNHWLCLHSCWRAMVRQYAPAHPILSKIELCLGYCSSLHAICFDGIAAHPILCQIELFKFSMGSNFAYIDHRIIHPDLHVHPSTCSKRILALVLVWPLGICVTFCWTLKLICIHVLAISVVWNHELQIFIPSLFI